MKNKKNLLKIRNVILFVNVTLILVMAAGLNLLTIYENTLIRQTETELNTQAFFISAMYKNIYLDAHGATLSVDDSEQWNPIYASLDLNETTIEATEPEPILTSVIAEGTDITIGNKLIPIIKETQRFTLASIQIVDANGIVISSTNASYLGLSMLQRKEVRKALNGKHVSLLRQRTLKHPDPVAGSISRSGNYRVHVAHPIVIEGKAIASVVLSRTPHTLWQVIDQYKTRISIYILSAFLLAWIISVITATAINRPIAALIEQANRALKGEKAAIKPLENPITEEVDMLSRTFSSLAQTLERRSEYILEFASHVSHEFKTPVTAMQGALELLIDHNDSITSEERIRFLHNLQKDSVRLENLVLRLLEFAKADLKVLSVGMCDVIELITSIINRHEYRNVHIELLYDKSCQYQISGSKESLDSIFTNLIGNAVQADSSIIKIELAYVDQKLQILVSDNGSGISEANQQKIFTPFFTTKRNAGGTGLGLAIIRSLLMQLRGEIQYQRLTDGVFKTQFIMRFPMY